MTSKLFTLPEETQEEPVIEPVTERDILNLLLARYNTERRGTIADRYVRAEHVRATQKSYGQNNRIADFIAIDKYHSTQKMIGHEVKVSRSDWLTELRDLSKAEPIKRYWHDHLGQPRRNPTMKPLLHNGGKPR